MRKTEKIKILGPKITCLFYADDGLILAKEKAERSIKIIREIRGKYGLQLNERKSQCILFNTKEKCEKNKQYRSSRRTKIVRSDCSYKQREMCLKDKRSSKLWKNQKIERDDKLCHWKKLPSSNDGENILERSGASKRSVWSGFNRHERRKNRQIIKSREHCNEKNLESTKVDCTSGNKRRDGNKQHEVENSKEQASVPKKDRKRK